MKQTVMIKGNAYGIVVVLDRDAAFVNLLEDIAEKFRESAKFFKNAKMALAFEGRRLTSEEQKKIIDVITENSTIQVLCVLDQDEAQEQKFKKKIEEAAGNAASGNGQFYKGTLRSGQVLESESSIIILGDVNPGGKVIAKGNIVVLGALKGSACAGISGNDRAFVAALSMNPMQIRIGDVIARSSDGPSQGKSDAVPKIAFVDQGSIYVEPICKETLNDINLI